MIFILPVTRAKGRQHGVNISAVFYASSILTAVAVLSVCTLLFAIIGDTTYKESRHK